MNLRQTVEIAGLVSAYNFPVIERGAALPSDRLQRYWTASRKRQGQWKTELDQAGRDLAAAPARDVPAVWNRITPTLEEIYSTEMLTRVWGATLVAVDRVRRTTEAEPLARNVMLGHMEARHGALELMVRASHVPLADMARLDRIRRRIERWTDLLLGHLVERFGLDDFAFDAERAVDFGSEQIGRDSALRPEQVWDLLLLSLRMAFPVTTAGPLPRAALQIEIVGTVLGCFPEDAFHQEGAFKTATYNRIIRSGDHAERHPRFS